MFRKKAFQCRECKKIYPHNLPPHCKKCGIQFFLKKGDLTSAVERVVIKRGLSGRWKVQGAVKDVRPEDIQHRY